MCDILEYKDAFHNSIKFVKNQHAMLYPSQISTMWKDHEAQKNNFIGKMQQELPEISQHRLKNMGIWKL